MNILLVGIGGHMGGEVLSLERRGYKGVKIVAGVDYMSSIDGVKVYKSFEGIEEEFDCIVDFSNHLITKDLMNFAIERNSPLVIATTGQNEEERKCIINASNSIPIFFASNYSMGIALLIELAKKTVSVFGDGEIEIIEKHHDRKVDAPSGTALTIAEELKNVRGEGEIISGRSGHKKREQSEIGISSIRMGNIVGEHEVIVGTYNETITLKHEAHSRALFAEGAITAAEFLINKGAGLYGMKDLIKF